jgi:hypothetical protein
MRLLFKTIDGIRNIPNHCLYAVRVAWLVAIWPFHKGGDDA